MRVIDQVLLWVLAVVVVVDVFAATSAAKAGEFSEATYYMVTIIWLTLVIEFMVARSRRRRGAGPSSTP